MIILNYIDSMNVLLSVARQVLGIQLLWYDLLLDWLLVASISGGTQLHVRMTFADSFFVPASHDNSKGKRCCTGLSNSESPTRTCRTPRTTPSTPGITFTTFLILYLPRLFSSDFTITISPTAGDLYFPSCFKLCRSRSPLRYSPVHIRHTASLHVSLASAGLLVVVELYLKPHANPVNEC